MKVLFFCQDGDKIEQMVLALRLRWPDLSSLVASQGNVGLQVIEQEEPDFVIICEDLPNLGIWTAIREIKMPCNLMVVMARVVALLRRVGLAKNRSEESVIHCGDLVIDPSNYEVFLRSERLMLTPTEFKLLYLLAKNRHMTLSQEFIHRIVWGEDIQVGETLKKYIQRLRRKLGDDARDPTWIKTVHGVGYRFSSPARSSSDLPTPAGVR